MKPTVKGFVAFVKREAKKDPKREIDHYSTATCAIGEYAKYCGINPNSDYEVELLLAKEAPEISVSLCHTSTEEIKKRFPTYGKLNKWLGTLKLIQE